MAIEIRPITPEEFDAFDQAIFVGFGNPTVTPEVKDTQRALCEFDRTLAAFDGDEIVGTTGIFSFDMTVPGATMPVAGVSWVSVKPTHRRQGALTQIMQRQLNDVRDRGEAIAALWASESIIYGRFGYGLAAQGIELKIAREHTSFAHQPEVCGRTRLVSRDDALQAWPAVYDRVLPSRPGMYSRSEAWWSHHALGEHDDRGGGFSGRFYVQYEEDGEPQGYARYRIQSGDNDGAPGGTLAVQELIAATDAAYAGLWRYVFGVDLVATIRARWRSVDEPLMWML
ncbi:MAG: GNAT family N-acetyltransferase, partial [Dehalococcoidia bacterium]